MTGPGVTVDECDRPGAVPVPAYRKERIMPRLVRTILRRLDDWTLESMNSPAGGRRPRL
jgi:hypothetical protein